MVKTDHILFIASGAFYVSKPSDLIPELQGRFPIRVELSSLSKEDFIRILTEPQNALLKQNIALMATEDIKLSFKGDAVEKIAEIATSVNERTTLSTLLNVLSSLKSYLIIRPMGTLWYALRGGSFTEIVIYVSESDARSLYWTFQEGYGCVIWSE